MNTYAFTNRPLCDLTNQMAFRNCTNEPVIFKGSNDRIDIEGLYVRKNTLLFYFIIIASSFIRLDKMSPPFSILD